jgi:hypothetical protein
VTNLRGPRGAPRRWGELGHATSDVASVEGGGEDALTLTEGGDGQAASAEVFEALLPELGRGVFGLSTGSGRGREHGGSSRETARATSYSSRQGRDSSNENGSDVSFAHLPPTRDPLSFWTLFPLCDSITRVRAPAVGRGVAL